MLQLERSRGRTSVLALLLGQVILLIAMTQPASLLAADGQVLSAGSDIAGDVTLANGHAKINFNNLGDCPVGLANCFVEIRFRWLCDEPWCFGWDESPWYKVASGADTYTHPGCADNKNKWEVKTRLHFIAPTTQTVRFRGGLEYSLGSNFLIPKFLFDVTTGTGFNGGVLITTKTGTDQFAGEGVLGQSNGFLKGPSSC